MFVIHTRYTLVDGFQLEWCSFNVIFTRYSVFSWNFPYVSSNVDVAIKSSYGAYSSESHCQVLLSFLGVEERRKNNHEMIFGFELVKWLELEFSFTYTSRVKSISTRPCNPITFTGTTMTTPISRLSIALIETIFSSDERSMSPAIDANHT